MATNTTTPDYYELFVNNTVVQPYEKNGNCGVGWYFRHPANLYTKECLVAVDVTGIPSGSTVNSVAVSFDIQSNSLGANAMIAWLQEQNQGNWTDTGSAPIYSTFTTTSWPSAMQSVTGLTSSSTGTKTFLTNSTMVTLWQAFVDGTKTAHDGVIIAMNTNTIAWWIDINTISIVVDYTPGATTRRIFLVT